MKREVFGLTGRLSFHDTLRAKEWEETGTEKIPARFMRVWNCRAAGG